MQTAASAKPQAWLRGEGLTKWLVIGLVILALIADWVLKVSIQGQTATFASETLSVRYPVDWLLGKDEEALFTVRGPDSPFLCPGEGQSGRHPGKRPLEVNIELQRGR